MTEVIGVPLEKLDVLEAAFANGRGGVCVLGVDDAPDFLVRLFQQRSQARIMRCAAFEC